MSASAPGPALGLLELESLARGVVVADALVKQAQVSIAIAEGVTPGKYLLVFVGAEGEVAESFKAGIEAGGPLVLDSLHLHHIAEPVVAALLRGEVEKVGAGDSVGIVELHTVAATLRAADTALKSANVRMTQFQVARGIGGKGWFTLAGEQHDVEAALERAAASVAANLLVTTELISRPHADLRGRVL
ncbi:MAG: BMC domain-containing protein [Archangium sp.]